MANNDNNKSNTDNKAGRFIAILLSVVGEKEWWKMKELNEVMRRLKIRTGYQLFYIDKTCSGKRLCHPSGQSGCQEISPRLPAGQLAKWIDAFIEGYEFTNPLTGKVNNG
jgi:hypothetical protein